MRRLNFSTITVRKLVTWYQFVQNKLVSYRIKDILFKQLKIIPGSRFNFRLDYAYDSLFGCKPILLFVGSGHSLLAKCITSTWVSVVWSFFRFCSHPFSKKIVCNLTRSAHNYANLVAVNYYLRKKGFKRFCQNLYYFIK